jgi:hypothetical protein
VLVNLNLHPQPHSNNPTIKTTGARPIMTMKAELINQIAKQIYRRYPEFEDIRPRVRVQNPPEGARNPAKTYLLTFSKKATLGDGKILTRMLRVVTDENGKLIKVTTSR